MQVLSSAQSADQEPPVWGAVEKEAPFSVDSFNGGDGTAVRLRRNQAHLRGLLSEGSWPLWTEIPALVPDVPSRSILMQIRTPNSLIGPEGPVLVGKNRAALIGQAVQLWMGSLSPGVEMRLQEVGDQGGSGGRDAVQAFLKAAGARGLRKPCGVCFVLI